MKPRSEELLAQLQAVMQEFESCLKQDSADSTFPGAELRARIEALRSKLGDLRGEIPRQARQAAEALDGVVRREPWSSLAIVAAAAFVCGLALSRRE